jgi:hypothetical protein
MAARLTTKTVAEVPACALAKAGLEGWKQAPTLLPSFEARRVRAFAPQDDGGMWGSIRPCEIMPVLALDDDAD